jgi:hypothetical protein
VKRRWIRWVGASLGVVALFTGGWVTASAVQSPAQREAAASAPAKRPVTAEVTKGRLSDSITSAVALERETRESVSLDGDGGPRVVTAVSAPAGSSLAARRALLEVNGRPLVALPGTFPFYRDLASGDTGPDVAQLQKALTSAGHPVASDGSFGTNTDKAVRALYTRLGYSVPVSDIAETSSESGGKAVPASDESTAAPTSVPTPKAAATTAPSETPSTAAQPRIVLPRSELVVVAGAPSVVVSTPQVGETLTSDAEVVVERGPIVAIANLPSSQGSRVRTGLTGILTDPEGKAVTVTVGGVTRGAGDKDTIVRMVPAKRDIDPGWATKKILVSLDIHVVADDALLVPSVAVITSGSGRAQVRIKQRDGTFLSRDVEEVGELGGRSAVRSLTADGVKPGDLVKVG